MTPGRLTSLLQHLAEAPAPPPRPLRPGERVGRFQVERELGRGGFGVVYAARDSALGRRVALKLVHRAGAGTPSEALLREAESAAALHHPGIVTLHDLGTSPEGPYLVFELLEGETLAVRLSRGPLPVREALRVAIEMARALEHAHSRGLVHRDLKPANVFLCAEGAVKVLDLGLASVFGREGLAGGTPGFMAPEQLRGELGDARVDVYAAAATLAQSLAKGGLAAAREVPPRLPRRLALLLQAGLAEDPAQRPANGAEWLARLTEAAAAHAAVRRRTFFAAAAVLALLLAGAYRWTRPGPHASNPAAAALLASSERACERGETEACIGGLRQAIALEPELASAHHLLSMALSRPGQPLEEARAEIAMALQDPDRLSPRDRLLAEAWQLHLAGRDADASRAHARAAARYPNDAVVLHRVGTFHYRREEYDRALPYFERATSAAPGWGSSAFHEVNCLLALGRATDAEARARAGIAASSGAPDAHAMLARALSAQGRTAEAVAALRRAVELGGKTYLSSLARNLLALGRWAEAEEAARDYLADAERTRDAGGANLHVAQLNVTIGRWLIGESLAYRGRRREAAEVLGDEPGLAQARALLLAGDRDAAGVRREVERALTFPDPFPIAATLLADAGAPQRARALADRLEDGAPARLYAAVVAWRERGDTAPLRELVSATRDPYAAFFLGEALLQSGDPGGAAEALSAFHGARAVIPAWGAPAARLGIFGASAYGRSLLLLARAHAARADGAAARRAACSLLELLRDADPGSPLVAEAAAMAGVRADGGGAAAARPAPVCPGERAARDPAPPRG